MTYRVMPSQYAKLTEARNGWPEKLSFSWGSSSRGCAVAYLTGIAGLTEEVRSPKWLEGFSPGGVNTLSDVYGIPTGEIMSLYNANMTSIFGAKKRSRRVLQEFQRILDNVEVIPEPQQTHATYEDRLLALV